MMALDTPGWEVQYAGCFGQVQSAANRLLAKPELVKVHRIWLKEKVMTANCVKKNRPSVCRPKAL
jgi:hypothetical protein